VRVVTIVTPTTFARQLALEKQRLPRNKAHDVF
jgi:hypothetical protein